MLSKVDLKTFRACACPGFSSAYSSLVNQICIKVICSAYVTFNLSSYVYVEF